MIILQTAGDLAAASGQLLGLVMIPFLVGLLGAIGTIFVRLLTHPWERYYNAMRRLQRHRWEALEAACPSVSATQSDGGAVTRQPTNETSPSARTPRSGTASIPRDGKRDHGFGLWNPPSTDTARLVIETVLESGGESLPEWIDLHENDTVADGLSLLEEPKQVYRRCRWSFRHSFWLFVVAWIPGVFAGGALLLPRTPPLLVGVGVLLVVSAVAFFGAIYKAYRFWWLRKRMDRLIEEAEMF